MNSGFSRSLTGQIDWHIMYGLVEPAKKKKNRYFSVQNFKPLTDKVEMEQFKGAAINLSASKFCE